MHVILAVLCPKELYRAPTFLHTRQPTSAVSLLGITSGRNLEPRASEKLKVTLQADPVYLAMAAA